MLLLLAVALAGVGADVMRVSRRWQTPTVAALVWVWVWVWVWLWGGKGRGTEALNLLLMPALIID